MSRKYEVWTKRCDRGADCVAGSYVPDDVGICDHCLLGDFRKELGYGTHDALDHMGMVTLYEEDDVIAALRKAMEKDSP